MAAGLLLAGALAVAGCSASTSGGSEDSAPSSPGGRGTSSSAAAGAPVDCSGTSCSLTFTGDVTSGSVLGTRVAFGGVQNGQATLTVGNRTVSCRQGDSVSAGPLRLTCTTVAADRVTLTAGLGG